MTVTPPPAPGRLTVLEGQVRSVMDEISEPHAQGRIAGSLKQHEPVARQQEPVARLQEPVAKLQEPIAWQHDPVARQHESSADTVGHGGNQDVRWNRLLFEVEMDLGGGRIVPIRVHEGDDADTLAAGLAREHGLAEADLRRVSKYLQRVTQSVSSAQ